MIKKEGEVRIPSGCAISAIINRKGVRFTGDRIIKSIALMHDRSNGLGGGFAAYGIYPEYKDFTAFHVFYDDNNARNETEVFINEHFSIESGGRMPTRKTIGIVDQPLIWRYFVKPHEVKLAESELSEDEFTARCVIKINSCINGAYIFSSGKNMGAFKAVGYPEDVGEFYKLDEYKGHLWTSHGRFPTNTPGWWGGAHPFTILDWSIVHNGEISSYDANRRYIEMFGYNCTLQTDTEVITYLFDFLVRKQKMSLATAADILAAPMWNEIDQMPEEQKRYYTTLRSVYASALINGPFSILVGSKNGLLALNDRLKLRALVAAQKGDEVFMASEESAIRVICDNPEKVWSVAGGKPLIIEMEWGDKT
ncbi:MAG: class II glutamine amidotransferase [Saccharofermentanales bacterium]